MLAADVPSKYNIPFGNSAGAGFIRPIPQASQIGIEAGSASLTDGFPPVTFLAVGAGGTPPWGADFNGLLNQETKWSQWFSAGGPVAYDSAFQTAIGGYPKGAIIASATTFGVLWFSTTDNNVTNPDASGAGWAALSPYGSFTTGDVKITFKTVADPGWVMITDGTIGSAASGATYAAADAASLYSLLWTNVVNTYAPVSGGRGGSAAADFAANKTLKIPIMLGRALASAGAGSGLTSRALGQFLGEETHALVEAENGPHTHDFTAIVLAVGSQIGAGGIPVNSQSTPTTSSGSGTGHNTMQPTTFLNLMIKL